MQKAIPLAGTTRLNSRGLSAIPVLLLMLAACGCPATAMAADVQSSTFASTTTGGNWSAVATWQTQDRQPPNRIPGDGDIVTINGPVTVDAPVTVGAGTNDAIILVASDKAGDKKLIVAAALTVRGGLRINGQSVVDVRAGAGIEMDGAAGITPAIHASHGSAVHLYLHGTDAKRCWLRTKAGTAGNPGRVMADGAYVPVNAGASYTDFTGFGTDTVYGISVMPSSKALMTTFDHCTFNRASLAYADTFAEKTEFTFSNCVFSGTTPVKVGDMSYGATFAGNFDVNLVACGFDKRVSLDQPKDIRSTVFGGNLWPHQYRAKAFEAWSDNLVVSHEPVCGYFIPRPGTYRRSYIICPGAAHNEHVVGAKGPIVFDQCVWDVPLTRKGAIDDALMVGGECTVSRCLSLPRLGGDYPATGVSLGFIFGGPITYRHNTIALGRESAIYSDPSHGGKPGEFLEFKNNLFYVLGTDPKAAGAVFQTFGGLKDPVKPEDCDYNNLWRSQYGAIDITAAGKLGVHDVAADPGFVDPTRNLTTFYRSQPGVQSQTPEVDVTLALDWIRQHPEKMPEMIDWVFAGYVPTNPALRAASDMDGPTKGWIGAMEGKALGRPAPSQGQP